ncbi:PadR family transcriptional regulator [Halosegnis longus]|uniref:PadR family transcriptional regulator n=1 Tax=Halosegnis longus TaxID=2216012 RepID=UPI00129EBF01|nr:helix-turn-helix transcriptional regulator [Halosegnis longus]
MTAPADTELTRFQLHLLATVADTPAKGTAIQTQLETQYGSLGHARIYQNLDSLVEAGYVEKRPLDGRTNQYRLTDAGHEILAQEASFLIRYTTLEHPSEATRDDAADS